MRIIPVIDLMGGVVVRGVAGRRDEYRPIESRLVDSSTPEGVAGAFRDRLGLEELYLADLDAIAGGEPNWITYAALRAMGLRLMIDAGVRDIDRAQSLRQAGVDVVVGLETLPGPQLLVEALKSLGPESVVFSLDLKQGAPLGDLTHWRGRTAEQIAEQALACGVRRMIVLDLARVGVDGGVGTEELCRRLRQDDRHLELVAGGGVRGADDLKRLEQAGVAGVLVASALHDGRLGEREIRAICRPSG